MKITLHYIPWKDSIPRPITSISSVAVGDYVYHYVNHAAKHFVYPRFQFKSSDLKIVLKAVT
jgi:hypothetical protein